jgi:D-arabinose 1-dehydrogenase-like Zn-dependent alcohol dehydrogenase
VDTVLSLHEVAQAYQCLEQGEVRGKIVLQVGTN